MTGGTSEGRIVVSRARKVKEAGSSGPWGESSSSRPHTARSTSTRSRAATAFRMEAPEFEAKDLEGRAVKLSAWKGKPVLFITWTFP